MNNKTLIWLSIAFVAVIIASVVVYDRPAIAPGDVDPLGMHTLTNDAVSSIALTAASTTQVVEHTDSDWTLDGVAVDTKAIDALLSGLPSAHEQLVARRGRETVAYGLTSGNHKTLTFTVQGTQYSYDIGSSDYRTQGVYVARTGEDTTYLVSGTTIAPFADETFSTWIAASTTASTSTSQAASTSG